MSEDVEHTLFQIKVLIGGTITRAVVNEEFAGFRVRCLDGIDRRVLVQRDAEGNGPGWLDIKECK